MTSSLSEIVRRYLTNFQEVVRDVRANGAVSVEMATRPVVHQFVQELVRLTEPSAEQARVLHDVVAIPGNRPDWRIEDTVSFGVFVYGDHKDLHEAGPFHLSGPERSQMERYLSLGRPVFVFDGIEFIVLDPKADDPFSSPMRLCIVPKPLSMSTDWASLPVEPLVEPAFAEMLGEPGFRKWSEGDLIEQLAGRARFLADEVSELLGAPRRSGADDAENQLIDSLHDLQEQLAEHHDPSLRSTAICSEFIAQVLIFGMFYAHTQAPAHSSTPGDRHKVIRTFWSDDAYLDVAERLRPFHSITKVLGASLTEPNGLSTWYRDAAAVLAHAEYIGTASGPTDYHALFERFLAAFSPDARFDFGAWYTPGPLTQWMVQFSDTLCRHSFGQGITELTDKFIDPCVGTGGFVEAYVDFASSSGANTSLIGFEVLPAPYALAQYRLANAVRGTSFGERLYLLLTDTLADQVHDPPSPLVHDLDQEVAQAASLVGPPLRLVMGNPPSSIGAVSHAPRHIVDSMMEDFRPPANLRTDRQNTQKAINNEAYRFLRWCADRVLSADRGMLALVLPGSFVHAVSLRYAREWMRRNFSEIWILELDEDARNGARTESLFNVMQGRAVLVGVVGGPHSGVHHLSISSLTLHQKIAFLTQPSSLTSFAEIDGAPDQLAPRAPYPEEAWNFSWPLLDSDEEEGIFRLKCSGVKLGLTALFHTDRLQLIRRSKALASIPLKTFEEIRQSWFQGQQRPPQETKLTVPIRQAIARAVDGEQPKVSEYTFRPLVQGYAVVDDLVFRDLTGLAGRGTRARPEIRSAFEQGAAALLVAPSPRDLGASLSRFTSFAWRLPDNDNASRGNSMVYCDRYPAETFRRVNWDQSAVSNTGSRIRELFTGAPDADRALLFYCYAVMSCGAYLEAFEPVLYVSSDPGRPFRVPIAADNATREQLVDLGKQLAELEDFSLPAPLKSAITAKWPDAIAEFELVSYQLNDDVGEVVLAGPRGQLAVVRGVSADSCTHRISGHLVLEKWLRERKFVYLRRTFRREDLEALVELISRLEHQLVLLDEIDLLVAPLLANPHLLARPHPAT